VEAGISLNFPWKYAEGFSVTSQAEKTIDSKLKVICISLKTIITISTSLIIRDTLEHVETVSESVAYSHLFDEPVNPTSAPSDSN
jgi:hypothetical protein